jgi:hypothetical protein
MLKLACGWFLVLAVIVLIARHYFPERKAEEQAAAPKSLEKSSNEEQVVYTEAWNQCSLALSNFLAAGTPEARNQFVFQPVKTASRMARFYGLNPIVSMDPSALTFSEHAVLDIPGGKQLESFWKVSDGRMIDAVFRQENGEWKLDWDHFVRYSDYPWALFLSGTGNEEGEFRLLARERLAEDRKNAESISIVLYAPKFGNPRDAGFQSPEFLVSRKTREGRLLDAAFNLARRKKKVFGSTSSNIDPEGMIRVRVRVSRKEVETERKFEITKLIACHWYSVDDPGVEPMPESLSEKSSSGRDRAPGGPGAGEADDQP